jgi:competence protein ComGC
MLKQLRKHKKKVSGQTLMEYTMVLGVISIILFAMAPLFQRGTQGMIKMVADQVGIQENAEQAFDEKGHLVEQYIVTRANTDKETKQLFSTINYIYNDTITTTTNSFSNIGFSKTSS